MLKASDIMTRPVYTIRGAATVDEAVKIMKERGVHALIVERRHPQDAYGIISATDIVWKVAAYGKDPKQVRVYELMSKPCVVINPDLGVEYVARLFSELGLRCAPVIRGEELGIITDVDILTKSEFVERPQAVQLEDKLAAAVERARVLCEREGFSSETCAAAWRVVEDLQAELAYQRNEKPHKTAFEEYVETHPELADLDRAEDAEEEVEYDLLVSGYAGL
ncbi:MAG: CBS domain-containing protein [Cyanobacteria bacterium J06639_1]